MLASTPSRLVCFTCYSIVSQAHADVSNAIWYFAQRGWQQTINCRPATPETSTLSALLWQGKPVRFLPSMRAALVLSHDTQPAQPCLNDSLQMQIPIPPLIAALMCKSLIYPCSTMQRAQRLFASNSTPASHMGPPSSLPRPAQAPIPPSTSNPNNPSYSHASYQSAQRDLTSPTAIHSPATHSHPVSAQEARQAHASGSPWPEAPPHGEGSATTAGGPGNAPAVFARRGVELGTRPGQSLRPRRARARLRNLAEVRPP